MNMRVNKSKSINFLHLILIAVFISILFSFIVHSADSLVNVVEKPIIFTDQTNFPNLFPVKSRINITGFGFGPNSAVLVTITSKIDNVSQALGSVLNFSGASSNYSPNIQNVSAFPLQVSTDEFGRFNITWNSTGARRINYTIFGINTINNSKNYSKDVGIQPPYPFIINITNTTNITIPFLATVTDPNGDFVTPENDTFFLDSNLAYVLNASFTVPTVNQIVTFVIDFTNAFDARIILGYDDKPQLHFGFNRTVFDNTTNTTRNETVNLEFDRAFTFNPLSAASFQKVVVTFDHPFVTSNNSFKVYKCADWVFFNRTCPSNNFTNILNLTQGTTRTSLTFFPGDPYLGFIFPRSPAAPPVSTPPSPGSGGEGGTVGGLCIPNLICQDWVACSNNFQTRLCLDGCGYNYTEERFCLESCFNNVQDQGEQAIDCGGRCRRCDAEDIARLKALKEAELEEGFIIPELKLRKIDITLLAVLAALFLIYLKWHHQYFKNLNEQKISDYLKNLEKVGTRKSTAKKRIIKEKQKRKKSRVRIEKYYE